jgi:hypothetical protein
MDSSKENNKICLNLSNDEALVLFEWLGRFNEKGYQHFSFQDQSEERVLFDLESILEKSLAEIFDENYKDKLSKARDNIRDHG